MFTVLAFLVLYEIGAICIVIILSFKEYVNTLIALLTEVISSQSYLIKFNLKKLNTSSGCNGLFKNNLPIQFCFSPNKSVFSTSIVESSGIGIS